MMQKMVIVIAGVLVLAVSATFLCLGYAEKAEEEPAVMQQELTLEGEKIVGVLPADLPPAEKDALVRELALFSALRELQAGEKVSVVSETGDFYGIEKDATVCYVEKSRIFSPLEGSKEGFVPFTGEVLTDGTAVYQPVTFRPGEKLIIQRPEENETYVSLYLP